MQLETSILHQFLLVIFGVLRVEHVLLGALGVGRESSGESGGGSKGGGSVPKGLTLGSLLLLGLQEVYRRKLTVDGSQRKDETDAPESSRLGPRRGAGPCKGTSWGFQSPWACL